jgi:hypothetical protein
MGEWNADVYHRVSDPQAEWGRSVLARLPLQGDELVLDVGCGTGRLTADLLARLPRGKAVGVDLSSNMLGTARANLRTTAGTARVAFVLAHASALPFAGTADWSRSAAGRATSSAYTSAASAWVGSRRSGHGSRSRSTRGSLPTRTRRQRAWRGPVSWTSRRQLSQHPSASPTLGRTATSWST